MKLSLAVPLFALSCAACSVAPEATSRGSGSIVGGTPATAHPEAVLVDLYQGGQLVAYCSGSLVGPYAVLTAGHCTDGYDSWMVTAPYAQSQTAVAGLGEVLDWKGNGDGFDAAEHDVGLLFLATPIQLDAYPAIATQEVADGTQVVDIGRIQNGTLSTTALYASQPIAVSDGTASGVAFDYVSTGVIESGDSGGPAVITSAGGDTIVGVNSASGGGTQVLARTDLVAGWIAQEMAAHPDGAPMQRLVDRLSGKCLQPRRGETVDGAILEARDCAGEPGQAWILPPQGQQGVILHPESGRCMDLTASNTADGTGIELYDCHGGPNQQWIHQADGSIVNPLSGKCVNLWGGSSANGTQARLYECQGSANELWVEGVWSGGLAEDQTTLGTDCQACMGAAAAQGGACYAQMQACLQNGWLCYELMNCDCQVCACAAYCP